MRYSDSGGLTAAGRARREAVRLQATQMFKQSVSPVRVAYRLRVSTRRTGKARARKCQVADELCRARAGAVKDERTALDRMPDGPIERTVRQ
jgi:hypothetical protein